MTWITLFPGEKGHRGSKSEPGEMGWKRGQKGTISAPKFERKKPKNHHTLEHVTQIIDTVTCFTFSTTVVYLPPHEVAGD